MGNMIMALNKKCDKLTRLNLPLPAAKIIFLKTHFILLCLDNFDYNIEYQEC